MIGKLLIQLAVLSATLFLPGILHSEDIPSNLNQWIVISPPKYESLQSGMDRPCTDADPGVRHLAANYSSYEWEVFGLDGSVGVRRIKDNEMSQAEVPVFKIPL